MTQFAVGFADFFDNDLVVEVVEADDVHAAILGHSKFKDSKYKEDDAKWLADMPKDIDELKEFFFNADILFGAIKI